MINRRKHLNIKKQKAPKMFFEEIPIILYNLHVYNLYQENALPEPPFTCWCTNVLYRNQKMF